VDPVQPALYLAFEIEHNGDYAPDEPKPWYPTASLSVEQLREALRPEAEETAKLWWKHRHKRGSK